MPRRLVLILFFVIVAVLFILGILVNYLFLYGAFFLLMIYMHIFGHGHHGGGGHEQEDREKDEGNHGGHHQTSVFSLLSNNRDRCDL